MAGLLGRADLPFSRRPRQPRHDQSCHDKSQRDMAAAAASHRSRQRKSGENDAGPQQQAADEPQRRPLGRNALANRPPKAAEEDRPEQPPAAHANTRVSVSVIFVAPDPRALPGLGWRPNARRSDSRAQRPATKRASVQECWPGCCLSNQLPSAAPSKSRNDHRPAYQAHHAQAEPDAWRGSRRALSLRAALAPTCAAKVGSLFDGFLFGSSLMLKGR